MKEKSENRKALPKFFLIMLAAGVIGGILGGASSFAGFFWQDRNPGAALASLLRAAAVWGLPAGGAVLLGTGLFQYRSAAALFRNWDQESEAPMARAETLLSWALLVDGLALLLAFFFFAAGFTGGSYDDGFRTLILLAEFLLVAALAVLLQQKIVDLTKRMNPEKRGSVYDMKFQKIWMDSCDEAEQRQIGQASYKAYTAATKLCCYLWGIFFLGDIIFHYGVLPCAIPLVIWGVMQVVYTRECIRLSEHAKKD